MGTYPRLAFLLGLAVLLAALAGTNPARSASYTIYFESDRDGEARVFKLEGSDAVAATDLGCRHPSITADGRILIYTRIEETLWGKFWNAFYILDGNEEKLTKNEIYDELEPVISHDGTFTAYTTMRAGNLEIITDPIDPNELQYRITDSEKPDESPALVSGDEWVYWTGRTGVYSFIFRAPARGGDIERISTNPRTWEEHPSVSADGRYVVYCAVTPEEPAVEETETTEEAQPATETSTGASELSPPLGSFAASAYPFGYLMYPGMGGGGSMPQQPDEEDTSDSAADTAATGPIPQNEGNSDIWVLDLETGERTRLTDDPAWDGRPTISADGMVIVFTSDRDGNYEIYKINRDGSALGRLTENEANDDYATIT